MPECPASLDGISHLLERQLSQVEGQASQDWAGLGRWWGAKSRLRCTRRGAERDTGLSKATGREASGRALSPVCPTVTLCHPPIGALGVVRSLAVLASEALEGSGVSYQRDSLISSVPMWLSPGEQQQCQERTEGEARTGCRRVNSEMPQKQKPGEQQLRPRQQEGVSVP